jgi:hypothetical protein
LALVAGEIAALGGQLSCGTPRQVVALRWGLTPGEAGRVVRLGERLGALPQIREAFVGGGLSEATADTLVGVATPANEAMLLDTARVATGAQLQGLVRHYRDLTSDPEAPAPRDSLRGCFDDQGRYRLVGSMTPADGAIVDAALDLARDRDRADRGPTPGETVSDAQALTRVAEAYLAEGAAEPTVLAERFHTMVLLDGDGASLAGGPHLEDSLAAEVLCSSWLSALISKDGRPVTATSQTRFVTPAQRRALWARDRCCAYPGCGRTKHLHAHHLVHYANGGPTSVENNALLCPTHHRRVHQPGWHLWREDRVLHITDPNGHIIAPVPARQPTNRTACEAATTDAVPPRPPPAGDRLTDFGRDVILHHWLQQPPAA